MTLPTRQDLLERYGALHVKYATLARIDRDRAAAKAATDPWLARHLLLWARTYARSARGFLAEYLRLKAEAQA